MSSRDIFFFFLFGRTTAAVDAGLRELTVVGEEEEEDLGLRWVEVGNGEGGENGGLGWSGVGGLGIVLGERQRDDGVRG